MTHSFRMAGSVVAAVILFLSANIAHAAEIKVLCAIAMQQLLEDLGPKFERASGHRIAVTIATLGPALKRVQDGENYDVVWLPQRGIESLVKDSKIIAGGPTVASTGIGVAVRNGAPKPDISSPEVFKQTMIAAKSVTPRKSCLWRLKRHSCREGVRAPGNS